MVPRALGCPPLRRPTGWPKNPWMRSGAGRTALLYTAIAKEVKPKMAALKMADATFKAS